MTSGSADTQHLIEQVRSEAVGGPYVVAERPYGFDLTIDVADARWSTLIRQHGLDRVFTHEVHLDEAAHALTITDVSNQVRWDAGGSDAGGLSLHAEKSVQRGRVHSWSFQKELGVDTETGEAGQVVDYSFASGEGRDLIRQAAESLGWRERMGRDQRIGLAFAGIAVAGLLVAGLITLVIKLAG
jgi:hypothetical protein